MIKKVLLITPPYHSGVVEVAGSWMPLGLAYLAGSLKKAGIETVIYDAMTENHTLKQIPERIKEYNPDAVGIGAYTSSINASLDVLKIVKNIDNNILTFLGGVHPSFSFNEIFNNPDSSSLVDYIIRGEGEITLPELINTINSGSDLSKVAGLVFKKQKNIIVNEERPFIEDLDSIEPDWTLINWPLYTYYMLPNSRLGVISSSRGCIKSCSFCSQKQFWKETWRGRKPENVVKEIKNLYNNYKVNVFLITDEYPTKDRDRWEEILDRLIAEEMDIFLLIETCVEDIIRDKDILNKYRKAGIIHIYVGVEATDQTKLDSFNKDLKVEQSIEAIRLIDEYDMISETSFVLGVPDETPQSIKNTLQAAKLYNPDFAHFLCLAPWPYADMYKDLKPYIKVFDYSQYNLVAPVIKPENMELDQVFSEVINCYKEFYMEKVPAWIKMKNSFKKTYLVNSMKAILKNSFLKTHMAGLGHLPDSLKGKIT